MGTLHEDQSTILIISGSVLLELEMFQTRFKEEIKTHILCSITFFRKSCRLWDNVEKYCRAWQATDDNMAHVRCMPDN
jgi:hypothetical protein